MNAYKTDKFDLQSSYSLEFWGEKEDDELLQTQNVCLFTLLRCKSSKKLFLTTNNHLLFNRDRGDIKLLQIWLIKQSIEAISKAFPTEPVYFVWAGDFNTLPFSPLYLYIRYNEVKQLLYVNPENWSGQTNGVNLWKQSKVELSRLEEDLCFHYIGENSKGVDKCEKILNAVSSYTVRLSNDSLIISKSTKPGSWKTMCSEQRLQTRSAYASDWQRRTNSTDESSKMKGPTGEMLFSTVPIQDPYPVTVDYVL